MIDQPAPMVSEASEEGRAATEPLRDDIRLLERATLDGSAFGLEMLLIGVMSGQKYVQVPVNYLPRVGVSSVTGDFRKTLDLGFEMMGLAAKMRVNRNKIRAGRVQR